MKKIITTSLFLFFINFINGQVAAMYDVVVNGKIITNCSTIALGNNSSVVVNFTLKVTKPAYFDVSPTATFKVYLKKSGVSNPIQLDAIIVNNSAFGSKGTTWEGKFSKTISKSDIGNFDNFFYGEYSLGSVAPLKTCTYLITKNPSPTFEIRPVSQVIYCDPLYGGYRFYVSNSYNSPGSLSYTWDVGWGWSRNGVPVNGRFSTTEAYIDLRPTDFKFLPSDVQVTPVLNNVNQATKVCSISRNSFGGDFFKISGNSSVCIQSVSEVYDVVNLFNGCTISWDSSNISVAKVTTSGTQAIVVPVSKGVFNLVGVITNECGQNTTITKSISVIDSSGLYFEIERLNHCEFRYIGINRNDGSFVYNWELVKSEGVSSFYGGNSEAYFSACPPFSITMRLKGTNTCGTFERLVSDWLNNDDEELQRIVNPNKSNLILDNYSVSEFDSNIVNNAEFEIYPNPSNDIVNIKFKRDNFKLKLNSKIIAKLYDISGKKKREVVISDSVTPIDVHSLQKGIYILKISTNEYEESHKVLVN